MFGSAEARQEKYVARKKSQTLAEEKKAGTNREKKEKS